MLVLWEVFDLQTSLVDIFDRFTHLVVLFNEMRVLKQLHALAFLSLCGTAYTEDILRSQRLQKRDIDADGNFNICKSKLSCEVGGPC